MPAWRTILLVATAHEVLGGVGLGLSTCPTCAWFQVPPLHLQGVVCLPTILPSGRISLPDVSSWRSKSRPALHLGCSGSPTAPTPLLQNFENVLPTAFWEPIHHAEVGEATLLESTRTLSTLWLPVSRPRASGPMHSSKRNCARNDRGAPDSDHPQFQAVDQLFSQLAARIGSVPHSYGPRQVHRPRTAGAPESRWSQLDEFDLVEIFATRMPTLRKCSHHVRGRLRQAFSIALSERLRAKLEEIRAWRLFVFDPVHVVAQTPRRWVSWKKRIGARFEDYQQNRWADLVRRGLGTVDEHRSKSHNTHESEEQRRGRAVLKRVQQGQVSRARQ